MKEFRKFLLMALMGTLLVGCVSPKFRAAWRKAGETPSGEAGRRWVGRWESHKHGVGGPLRAVLTPPSPADPSGSDGSGELKAFFEAGWHGFTTAYPVVLRAEVQKHQGSSKEQGQIFTISGQHDLDSWVGGGLYHYSGTMGPDHFQASYQSKYDTGTFSLKRVESH